MLVVRSYCDTQNWLTIYKWEKIAIIVITIWVLLTHSIYTYRFYIKDMSSFSSPFGVFENLYRHSPHYLFELMNEVFFPSK